MKASAKNKIVDAIGKRVYALVRRIRVYRCVKSGLYNLCFVMNELLLFVRSTIV